jgi:hypothetical protein
LKSLPLLDRIDDWQDWNREGGRLGLNGRRLEREQHAKK